MTTTADQATPRAAAPLALAALVLGAAAIGFGPVFVRVADVGPVASAFWRVALSVPVLALWAGLRVRRPPGGRFGPLLACGLFFAADLGLWHWSIMLTSVANATLLANLNPVFVTLAGFFIFKDRFSRRFLLGLALALLGAAALMGENVELAPERLPGDALGVATAVMYAAYLITVSRLRRDHSALSVLLYSAIASAAALWPVALLSGERILPASPDGWAPLLALALVSQVLGQGLIIYALAHLSTAFSALTLLVQPVVAALAGWVLFDEALGPLAFAGAGAILAGILVARFAALEGARSGARGGVTS